MPSILITGANRGLGLEMTKQYLQDGWQVIACCRSPSKASELIDLESEAKEQLRILELDVNDANAISSLPSRVQNQPIDVLINNAGILKTLNKDSDSISPEAWLESFRVNTIAPALIAKSLSGLIAAGQQKIIVNLSSQLGSISLASDLTYLLYGSSKAALNYVTKSLAVELKSSGIIVISIHPGWAKTDMGGKNAQLMPAESVAGIRKVLKSLTLKQSGAFYDYSGKIIPY
ncbi:MAG: SDR family oxidoreductase [Proteobacteria bacterium]|nr:SDR family oxidoreductase [Pseudomonadota bacterium]